MVSSMRTSARTSMPSVGKAAQFNCTEGLDEEVDGAAGVLDDQIGGDAGVTVRLVECHIACSLSQGREVDAPLEPVVMRLLVFGHQDGDPLPGSGRRCARAAP